MTYLHLKSVSDVDFNHDFTDVMNRMYFRFFEQKGYPAKLISITDGSMGGLKEVIIRTDCPFDILRCESGLHSFADINSNDKQKRRHTVFAQTTVCEDTEFDSGGYNVEIKKYHGIGPGVGLISNCNEAIKITNIKKDLTATWSTCDKTLVPEDYLRAFASISNAPISKELVRRYTQHPYKLVKDYITGRETEEIERVLDGELELIWQGNKKIN